jgi:molecular chaperone GrpE
MKHKNEQKPVNEQPAEEKKAEPQKNELEELRRQIETLQKEKDELFGKLQRLSADYTNFQKRVPKQIADSVSYEKEKIIKAILPALDNFEHTLQNTKTAENIDALLKGVQIIYDHLLDILKSHNVEQIQALGQKFDPAQHEAMLQKTHPDKEENIVLEELQKGYKLNSRILRPSRVVVNKLPAEQAPPTEQKQQETTEDYETKDTE